MDICNIVAKCSTSALNLDSVQAFFSSNGYIVKRKPSFCGLFVRFPNVTCTFFSTGVITINGCKNYSDLKNIHLELLAFGFDLSKPLIVNMVARFSIGRKISLPELHVSWPSSFYNPDLHNAFQVKIGSVKVLMHSSGKGILTGAKSFDDLETAFEDLLMFISLKH